MTVEGKKNYGRTISGELITDELIEKLVREAEEGWDVEAILARESDRDSGPVQSDSDPNALPRRSRKRR